MAAAGNSNEGLNLGLFYLNQLQTAGNASITIDGRNDDWTTTKALFLSSEEGTEMILRFAHDSDNLYILSESNYNTQNEDITIKVATTLQTGTTIGLSSSGELSVPGNITAYVRSGKTSDSRNGYCVEAGIPLSNIGASVGSTIYVYATVGDTAFTSANSGSTSSWQRVKVQ